MNTVEGNKIIAEFMEVNKGWTDFPYLVNGGSWKLEGLKYHSSWDWLMPVVEKIESFAMNDEDSEGGYAVEISGCLCRIEDMLGNTISEGFKKTKKESVYQAVVNFIEWYNNQKPVI